MALAMHYTYSQTITGVQACQHGHRHAPRAADQLSHMPWVAFSMRMFHPLPRFHAALLLQEEMPSPLYHRALCEQKKRRREPRRQHASKDSLFQYLIFPAVSTTTPPQEKWDTKHALWIPMNAHTSLLSWFWHKCRCSGCGAWARFLQAGQPHFISWGAINMHGGIIILFFICIYERWAYSDNIIIRCACVLFTSFISPDAVRCSSALPPER